MTFEEMVEAVKAVVEAINKTDTLSAEIYDEDIQGLTPGDPIPFVINAPNGSFSANIDGPL